MVSVAPSVEALELIAIFISPGKFLPVFFNHRTLIRNNLTVIEMARDDKEY
jgi:hypothetical protein